MRAPSTARTGRFRDSSDRPRRTASDRRTAPPPDAPPTWTRSGGRSLRRWRPGCCRRTAAPPARSIPAPCPCHRPPGSSAPSERTWQPFPALRTSIVPAGPGPVGPFIRLAPVSRTTKKAATSRHPNRRQDREEGGGRGSNRLPAEGALPRTGRVRGAGLLRRATRRSMWVQAPFLLIRFPALLLAVGGAIAVLVAAVASGPLFLSSAQNAALEKQLAPVSRWNGGLTVVATGRMAGRMPYDSPYGVVTAESLFEQRDRLLREAASQ